MVLQKRGIFQMTHISPVPLQFEGTPSQLEGSIGDGLQESAFIQGIRDNVRNKFYVVSNHCCVFPTDSKGIRNIAVFSPLTVKGSGQFLCCE